MGQVNRDDVPDLKNYVLQDVLGNGSNGAVRRATHKQSLQECAVKVIKHTEQSTSTENEAENEVAILRACQEHPNVVTLLDVQETEDKLFLITELCGQKDLHDFWKTQGHLSETQTRSIMKQVFEVVQFIHSKGIVHRDLTMANILMDKNLNIKLCDFGLAKTVQEKELLRDYVGTPEYMAPETYRTHYEHSSGYGKEVDLWACGVIMFSLLSGSYPFFHTRQHKLSQLVRSARFNFRDPVWSSVSEEAQDLISKLFAIYTWERLTAEKALQHPFFNE